jgi:hypothetical protein
MRAAAAVKYFWILPAMLKAATSGREMLNRRPIEETVAAWAPVVPQLIDFSQQN